jgi:hypothetical protein
MKLMYPQIAQITQMIFAQQRNARGWDPFRSQDPSELQILRNLRNLRIFPS